MCGIFGALFAKADTVPDERLLLKTGELIGHRGPDSVHPYRGNGVGFVHTRLSLLDLTSRSDQPMWDRSGRYCLVYNGEVYNFAELRAELEQQNGVRFSTTSDTEVLLYALIHVGTDVVSRFEGMFAFAFYDKQTDRLLLGRDRFGIKPLYIYQDRNIFLFASEVKAFIPWVKLEPDLLSISSYLQGFKAPTLGNTFFRNVHSMQTGTCVEVVRDQPLSERRFFSLPEFYDPDLRQQLSTATPRQVVDRMDELLFTSVKKHLIADTQVGALCSGGVDSSLLMAMAARVHNNLAIFHSNVVGPHSEFDAASALAKHLKLDLKHIDVSDEDFISRIAQVTYHYGYPFYYHPNSVPFLRVTELVRRNGVKAVLTGEGADECYLGYSHLPTENVFHAYHRTVNAVGRGVRKIPIAGRMLWPELGSEAKLILGLHNRFEVDLERHEIRQRLQNVLSKNDLKTLDHLGYHLRTLLHRNDALGMAASIEARFPFLDHDLVKFAVNLPYTYKIHREFSAISEAKHPFMRSKWVLRQVAKRYLPPLLSQRRKRGFPTNAFERMRVSENLFKDGFVSQLFELVPKGIQYLAQHADRDFAVRLMHLEVWGRVCLEGESQESVTTLLRRNICLDAV